MLNTLAGIIASSGGAAAVGDFESIATSTLGSNTQSVTFSSIPSTYKHLQIRWVTRDSGTTGNWRAIKLQFNSDTGSNYAQHILYSNGATVAAYSATSQVSAGTDGVSGIIPDTTLAGSSTMAAGIWDILDHANTNKYKTARLLVGGDLNGSGRMQFSSGLWMSTSAISSITLTDNNDNFVTGSQFALYGVK